MKITFNCPDDLAIKIKNASGKTDAVAPNGLQIKLNITMSDLIINALYMYFAQNKWLEGEEECQPK